MEIRFCNHRCPLLPTGSVGIANCTRTAVSEGPDRRLYEPPLDKQVLETQAVFVDAYSSFGPLLYTAEKTQPTVSCNVCGRSRAATETFNRMNASSISRAGTECRCRSHSTAGRYG